MRSVRHIGLSCNLIGYLKTVAQMSHQKCTIIIFIIIFISSTCDVHSIYCKPVYNINFLFVNLLQNKNSQVGFSAFQQSQIQRTKKSTSLTYLSLDLLVVESNKYIHNEHADRVEKDDEKAIHPLWCVVKLIVLISRFDEWKANPIWHCLFNSTCERIHPAEGV